MGEKNLYRVRAGDTLAAIVWAYGLANPNDTRGMHAITADIAEVNGLHSSDARTADGRAVTSYVIRVGQQLVLPEGNPPVTFTTPVQAARSMQKPVAQPIVAPQAPAAHQLAH